MTAPLRLEARYRPADDPAKAGFELSLHNATAEALSGFRLAYSSIARAAKGATFDNATFIGRLANFHEVAPPEGLTIVPGGAWRFTVTGIVMQPKHRTDGPKSAYVTLAGGRRLTVNCPDIVREGGGDGGPLRVPSEGRLENPLGVLPWPNHVAIDRWRENAVPYAPQDAGIEETAAVLEIEALAARLFGPARRPFRLDPAGALPLTFEQVDDLGPEAYHIAFKDGAAHLRYAAPAGRAYGLTALAQAFHHAATDARCAQPEAGAIKDAPRFSWRGTHVDVSRHFWTVDEIKRLIDAMAWSRLNTLQWHLTDDEGWRLEIEALPELTRVGAFRGPGLLMPGQHGFIDRVHGGFYTQDQVRDLIGYAARLHVCIVPEIDIPGHCHAALTAYPHLRDPGEPADSYRSIQGYPNNTLNPAMEETYAFLQAVFCEVAALFPAPYIHVGADEVEHVGATEIDSHPWFDSPRARALMEREGLTTTQQMQAHLLRRVQAMIKDMGKKLAGWDEVSHGGGVDAEGTLLVAWQKPELIGELADQGYDVIASPGQAYYLDMAQAEGWNEPGTSWAGTVPVEHSYTYEAVEGLTETQMARVKGVQACIWSEHLHDTAQRNHMIFPRLYAVAEAGWTAPAHKDWPRFAALSGAMPQL